MNHDFRVVKQFGVGGFDRILHAAVNRLTAFRIIHHPANERPNDALKRLLRHATETRGGGRVDDADAVVVAAVDQRHNRLRRCYKFSCSFIYTPIFRSLITHGDLI